MELYHTLNSACAIGVLVTTLSTIVLNGVVIAAYCKMARRLKSNVTNVLLVNQAFADLSSVVPSLFWLLILFHRFVLGTDEYILYKGLWITFAYTGIVLILSLLATTLDKFICVRFYGSYYKMAGKGKIVIVILVTWVIPVLPAVDYELYVATNLKEIYTFAKVIFSVSLVFIFIILALLFFTFTILRSPIRRQIVNMTSLPLNERREDEIDEERIKERRLTFCLFLMVTTYAATILPDMIVNLIYLHLEEMGIAHNVHYWLNLTFFIYTLYATINPLLTIFLRDDFKQARRWVTCNKCCLTSAEEEIERELTILSSEL